MAPKRPGPSSAYLGAYTDKSGDWLDGANSYKLHVPPNAPAKLFWSVTLYDVDTRSLLVNEQKIADRSSRMRLVTATAAVGTFIGVLGTTLHAQDLEPRAYSNSPVGLNFVIAGYGYGSGTVLTDPALPLENVSNESHVGVLGFATTFGAFGQTGQFGLIVPYASIAAKGLVFGLPHTRDVDGFADTAFRLSMNFVGAPALTAAEFKDYHQDFIFGMDLYNPDKSWEVTEDDVEED